MFCQSAQELLSDDTQVSSPVPQIRQQEKRQPEPCPVQSDAPTQALWPRKSTPDPKEKIDTTYSPPGQ
jgi:hypothetical protein